MRIEMLMPLNLVLCIMVVIRMVQYLKKCKDLTKRIEKLDHDLYLQRYCDRVFKSPTYTGVLFEDIMNPANAPDVIRLNFSSDFRSIRESLYSTLRWFAALVSVVVAANFWFL